MRAEQVMSSLGLGNGVWDALFDVVCICLVLFVLGISGVGLRM